MNGNETDSFGGQHCCRACGHPLAPTPWLGGECKRCGSVSSFQLPSNEDLSLFYKDFNDNYSGGGRSGGKNLLRYARYYFKLVRKYTNEIHVLDIGCSNSPFPSLAATQGCAVTVMDYQRPRILESHVEFIPGNLNEDIAERTLGLSFPVVTAWAVLEHARDPYLAGKIIAGLCAPNGLIFITTPEIGTPLTNYSIGHSDWFNPPEHLHLFSPQGISTIFSTCGCDLVKWGRVELTGMRYMARYGIGCCEALIGAPLSLLAPATWRIVRNSRKQLFKGIAYYVIRKRL